MKGKTRRRANRGAGCPPSRRRHRRLRATRTRTRSAPRARHPASHVTHASRTAPAAARLPTRGARPHDRRPQQHPRRSVAVTRCRRRPGQGGHGGAAGQGRPAPRRPGGPPRPKRELPPYLRVVKCERLTSGANCPLTRLDGIGRGRGDADDTETTCAAGVICAGDVRARRGRRRRLLVRHGQSGRAGGRRRHQHRVARPR